MEIPHRNGMLRQLRREPPRYMTGGMGKGFDADALGEDIAAKFRESGENSKTIKFEHYILTYTDQEMQDRMQSLERMVDAIRLYDIQVDVIDANYSYTIKLQRKQ